MSISERAFEAITRFPEWLESFDAMELSGWTVSAILLFSLLGFIFAVREFLSWFLKTNSIIDDVLRLETLVRDLQGDLAALESKFKKLQTPADDWITSSTTEKQPTTSSETMPSSSAASAPKLESTKFPLNH